MCCVNPWNLRTRSRLNATRCAWVKSNLQALIDNMVQQGAQVTPQQEHILIQYFTQ